MKWFINTENGIPLSESLSDINAQIEALKARKAAIKAIAPKLRKLLKEHDKCSYGKGLYAAKHDVNGQNHAYLRLMEETRQVRKELESLGFTVSEYAAWDCLEIK